MNGQAVWVRVEGKGNFLNSGNLKEFAKEMVNRGYREFVVDLENCAMMDSTFMGTMAGVALRLKELGHGHLHVIHCGQRSRDLLTGLGLDQIFHIHSNGTSAPETTSCPQRRRASRRSKSNGRRSRCSTRTRRSVRPSPENFSRFKDVLDYLKQDLQAPAKK